MSGRRLKIDAQLQGGAHPHKAPSRNGRWCNEPSADLELGGAKRLPQERRGNEGAPVMGDGEVKGIFSDWAEWFCMNTDSIYFHCRCPRGSLIKAELQAGQAANLPLFRPLNSRFCQQGFDINTATDVTALVRSWTDMLHTQTRAQQSSPRPEQQHEQIISQYYGDNLWIIQLSTCDYLVFPLILYKYSALFYFFIYL